MVCSLTSLFLIVCVGFGLNEDRGLSEDLVQAHHLFFCRATGPLLRIQPRIGDCVLCRRSTASFSILLDVFLSSTTIKLPSHRRAISAASITEPIGGVSMKIISKLLASSFISRPKSGDESSTSGVFTFSPSGSRNKSETFVA